MFPKNADTAGGGRGASPTVARVLGNPLTQGNLRVRRTSGRPTNLGGNGANVTVNPNLPKSR